MESSALPSSLGLLLPGSPAVFPSAKGSVYLWETPRVIVSRVVGVLTVEGASAIEMAGRRVGAKHGKHAAFHDWEAMTDYEADARSRLVQAALDLHKVTEAIHVFATSNIVQLGLRAASLVVRSLQIHASRGSFEGELQRTLSAVKR